MAFVSERNRFRIIVSVLLAVAACVGYRLVAVHLNLVKLDVRDPRYWFTREIRGLRGGIYSDACGRQPFACSVEMDRPISSRTLKSMLIGTLSLPKAFIAENRISELPYWRCAM